MFATFRKEARDGEIICIANTSQPPLSGSQLNHFACDRCRSKKLKCSAHRFGCERCRDRNITCTYSASPQAHRRERRKLSQPKNASPRHDAQEKAVLSGDGADTDMNRIASTSAIPAQATAPFTITPPGTDDSSEFVDLSSTGDYVSSAEMPPNTLPCLTPATSSDIAMLDNMMLEMTSYPARYPSLDLDALDANPRPFGNEGLLSISPSDLTSLTNDITTDTGIPPLGDIDWNLAPFPLHQDTTDNSSHCLFSARSPTYSAKGKDTPRPASDARTPATISATLSSERGCGSAFPTSSHAPCRCMDIVLVALEQAQNHAKVDGLTVAEQSLCFVKTTFASCRSSFTCRTCWGDSRLITFSILLLEKIMTILEDISRTWEINLHATSATRKDSMMEEDSQSHQGDLFMLDGYRIDTLQERCDIFGFLIILQIKHLAAFSKSLSNRVHTQQGEKHQATLRPVLLRVQELHKALSETIGVLHMR